MNELENKNKNSNEKVSRLPQTEVKTYEQDNDDRDSIECFRSECSN